MKKRYQILAGSVFASLLALNAIAADTPLDNTKTRIALPMDEAPIIDGVVDDIEWAQAGRAGWEFRIVPDDQITEGDDGIKGADLGSGEKPESDADLSANISAGVVDGVLYIGVQVFDDDISTDSAEAGSENGETWQDDSVEIFIDGDNSNFPDRDTTGTNVEIINTGGQYVITPNKAYRHAEAGNPEFDPSSGWFADVKESADGYHAEFRFPLTLIGNPKPGEHIGFTVAINDDDGGGTTEGQLIWTGATHVEAGYGNLVVGHRRYEGLKAASPTIDGKIEDGEYPGVDIVDINPFTGVFRVGDDEPNIDDSRFEWRVTHNEEAIYVAVRVWDDLLVADTAEANSEDGNTWQDDSVEIFFDSNESNLGGRDNTEMFDGQFVFTTNGAWRDNEANNPTYGPDADWWAQSTVADDGKSWDVEFVVKKATLVGGDVEDAPMGFNVNINDDDGGGDRNIQLNWDGNPHTEASYGELILLSAIPSDPNAVAQRSVRFGRLDQSADVRTEVLKIRNAGDSMDLTLSNAEITGPDADAFTLSDFPASLAPGESAEATVTFDSGGVKGSYEATLTYNTNDPDDSEATLTVDLSAKVSNLAGPIARYLMDEADGDVMTDTSTFDRHGTYNNAVLGEAGLIDGGASVLFTGGGYGEVPGDVFDSFIRFSVAAWVNLEDLSPQQTIFAKGAGSAVTFALLSSGGDLEWFSNGVPEFKTDGAVLTAGTTHHVAITWSTTKAAIYVDGVLVKEQDNPTEIEIDQANAFVVGSFFGDLLNMNGRMDDVQFYDRAVSAEDVASLHAAPGSELTNLPVPQNAPITWQDPNSNTAPNDLIGGRSITFAPFAYDDSNAESTFFTGDGGTTGDADLDAVYNSHGWNSAGSAITLSGLTEGNDYMIQLLGAGDTRSCCDTRNQAGSDGLGNVSGDFPRGNSSVIGTFTAASSSQDIMIVAGVANGTDPGLSGFILTDGGGGLISAYNVGRTEGDEITVKLTTPVDEPGILPADSVADFGGSDIDNGWTYGYRNVPTGGAEDYDPAVDFIQFPETWWNGNAWDEPNADGDNVPWTTINAANGHPNGGGNKETHWAIRRWTSPGGPTEITYTAAKNDPDCGGGTTNGVTVGVHINGARVDSMVIPGDDGVGMVKTIIANLNPGDVVDLILSPRGTDGENVDGCDGSSFSMTLDVGPPDLRAALGMVSGSTGPLNGPALVDFGQLTGDATYEFKFKAFKDVDNGASTAIAGNDVWAIKLDQWNEQGLFGTTNFGVVDNVFTAVGDESVASVFEVDVHVVIVNDTTGGESRLYINGVLVGTAGAFELVGEISLMAAQPTFIDAMGEGSVMYGWATYNTALAENDIATLVTIPFPSHDDTVLPPLMEVGLTPTGALEFTLAAGVTADIQYSLDLQSWTTIASGVTGMFEETDAGRIAAPEGFYRAITP